MRAGQGRRMISGFTPRGFFARGVHPDHDGATERRDERCPVLAARRQPAAAGRAMLRAGPSLATLRLGALGQQVVFKPTPKRAPAGRSSLETPRPSCASTPLLLVSTPQRPAVQGVAASGATAAVSAAPGVVVASLVAATRAKPGLARR